MYLKMERKNKIKVNSKVNFTNVKMSAAFHGGLTLNQQKKNSKNSKINAISMCRRFELFAFC
jgi:hypothetical protein